MESLKKEKIRINQEWNIDLLIEKTDWLQSQAEKNYSGFVLSVASKLEEDKWDINVGGNHLTNLPDQHVQDIHSVYL